MRVVPSLFKRVLKKSMSIFCPEALDGAEMARMYLLYL